jgi:glycosyltransferase involved in cell wall biosynthesis
MSTAKNLTIAIVTRNRNQSLTHCLQSLVSQCNPQLQIVIIDNNQSSTLKTTLKKYRTTLKIRYFHQPIKGISRCRNLALQKCSTAYIAFVDDDCILKKNWLQEAVNSINSYPCSAFFQGISEPQELTPLIQSQQLIFSAWINRHNYINNFDPVALDTKNLILNLKIISKNDIKFDENLPRFEDTDFGLQLKNKKLFGIFNPNLLVFHNETNNLGLVLKKSFFSGQIKYLLNQKWNNFDSFFPKTGVLDNLKLFKNFYKTNQSLVLSFYQTLLVLSFNQGYINAQKNEFISPYTIAIVNTFDKSANEERSLRVSAFLNSNNYKTLLIDSQKLFDKNVESIFCTASIFDFIPYRICRFFIFKFKINSLKPWLFYFKFRLRGLATLKYLRQRQIKIVILEHPEDYLAVVKDLNIFLDMPTIYFQELQDSKLYPKFIVNQIKKYELNALKTAKKVAFHWYRILEFAQKNHFSLNSPTILNWGCDLTKHKASYSPNPQIVYIGNLNSDWVNPSLLENLTNASPYSIDIFSYEKPNSKYYSKLINFKGFLPDLNKLTEYQYGLITLKDNPLRNSGFSAKHLLYLSFGLPVLCPDTRKDPLLEPATIYYHKNNFSKIIKKIDSKIWQQKHMEAFKIADKLNWSETLKPLLLIIPEFLNEI